MARNSYAYLAALLPALVVAAAAFVLSADARASRPVSAAWHAAMAFDPSGATITPTAMGTPTRTPTCVPGGWEQVTSPSPGGSTNQVSAISARAANDAWAVGAYGGGGTLRTLALHWDGGAWTQSASPNPGATTSVLSGVDALAANDAWAVGYSSGGTGAQSLALHWDGAAWTQASTPNVGNTTQLAAVAAIAPDNAWAVGNAGNQNGQSFIVHWNGTSWTQAASPTIGTGSVYLTGITAVAANDIWAVGYSTDSVGVFRYSVALHWDGVSWTEVSTPQPGFEQRALMAVSAAGPNDVWAVGYYHETASYIWQTMTIRWNGIAWSLIPSPNPLVITDFLFGVKAISANDAWAVGNGGNSNIEAMLLHWDGAQWTPALSPVASPASLFAVDGVSGGLWAGGYGGYPQQTLILRYREPVCNVTPTVTSTPTITRTPTVTPTPCPMNFSDVQPPAWFYDYVRCLYCRGAVSGYADGTFRPYNNTTRGQLSKIVVLGFALPINTTGGPHFTDVAPGSTFYNYVETAYNEGLVSGYADGTFRPGNNVTRGQLSKIVVVAGVQVNGWPLLNPPTPAFSDVPPDSTFYIFVETAVCHGIVSGYSDGTFRPSNNATRAQIAKIVCLAVRNEGQCAP